MTLTNRLFILLGIVIIVISSCLLISLHIYSDSAHAANALRQRAHEDQLIVSEIKTSWLSMLSAWKDLLILGTAKGEYHPRLKTFYQEERHLRDRVQYFLDRMVDYPEVAQSVNEFQQKLARVATDQRQALLLFNESTVTPQQMADQYAIQFYDTGTRLIGSIDRQLVKNQQRRLDSIESQMTAQITALIVTGVAIAVGLVVLVIWQTFSSTIRPLNALNKAATQVAQGKNIITVEQPRTREAWSREFGILFDTFNEMVASLNHMKRELQEKIRELEQENNIRRNAEENLKRITRDLVKAQDEIYRYADNLEGQVEARTKELWHQANYDTITQLPNRNLFFDRLNQAIRQGKRHQKTIALLYIDLDQFKRINDSFGHELGDKALKEAARRLSILLRNSDTVARLGGDEFAIILTELKTASSAAGVAEKLKDIFKEPVRLSESQEIVLTASIGISIYPDDATSGMDLLKFADVAMYRAKQLGRNHYAFYTSSLGEVIQRRSRIERALHKSNLDEDFYLQFQPIVDANNQSVSACEALLRWHSQDLGNIAPIEFIPVAEECGKIMELGRWTLLTACSQQVAWREDGLGELRIAVNISALQFSHPFFLKEVKHILEVTGVNPGNLELEITESCIMKDAQASVKTLNELKAMGIILSIDDFGTGYSSLNYLKRFPLDNLKIDRSFVCDIFTDSNDEAICRAIIALAKTLDINVIAEGIETSEHATLMQKLGCNELQGYYFAPPLSPEEFSKKNLMTKI